MQAPGVPVVQLADRTNPHHPAPVNEPFHCTTRRLTEAAEGAQATGNSEMRNAVIGALVLHTNDPIKVRRHIALEALLRLCLNGVVKPANLAHVGNGGELARKVREFAQRLWRAGNPRPEDLLLLAFGHGLISQTALGWNVPDELLVVDVRERMHTQ